MDGMHEEWLIDLVDEQLRFLRGEGPAPDLGRLTDTDRAEVRHMLELLDALADSNPPSPPLHEDPVAIRLGLVDSPPQPATDNVEAEPDPIVASVEELSRRFGGAIHLEFVRSPGISADALQPVVVCRSLAEAVLVVVYADRVTAPGIQDARGLFHDDPDWSAVVFTTEDAVTAAVVSYRDCFERLIPAEGWRSLATLTWEPLGIALGRYFERSVPRWDEVTALTSATLLDDLAGQVLAVVAAHRSRLAASRVQLSHKRHARDFVANLDQGLFVSWVDEVRAGRVAGGGLADRIAELCQTGIQ